MVGGNTFMHTFKTVIYTYINIYTRDRHPQVHRGYTHYQDKQRPGGAQSAVWDTHQGVLLNSQVLKNHITCRNKNGGKVKYND